MHHLKKEKKVMEFREVNVVYKFFKSSAAFYSQEQQLLPFTIK
jgi:F0F1-type ATP synthase gamma subunit